MRTLIGFLVGPIAPGLLLAALALVTGSPLYVDFALGMSAQIGYPVALLFGVPTYFFLRRKGWVAIHSYIIVGAALVAIAMLIPFAEVQITDGRLLTGPQFRNPLLGVPAMLPLAVFFGIIATSVFWLIARPDRAPGRRPRPTT